MGKKNKSLNKATKGQQQTQRVDQGKSQLKNGEIKNGNQILQSQKSEVKTHQNKKPQIKKTAQTKQIKKQQKSQQQVSLVKNQNSKTKKQKVQQNKDLKNQALKPRPQQPQVKGKPWSQLQYTLRDQIVQTLKRCGFKTMLPVQEASIPLLLKNYDLAVEAQTGSGKTLAFLIPLLEKYLAMNLANNQKKNQNNQPQQTKEFRPVIRYLITSPTRQLCQQTFNVLVRLLQNLPSKQRSEKYLKSCHCATGGSDMNTDIQKLKDSTIVFVGTVGRIRQLSQHMDQNWLKKVQYLYIDEADRVLKQKGIQQLIRSVQKIRRTAMFSATLQTLNQKNYQFYGMRNLAKISLKQTNTQIKSSDPQSNTNEQKKYIIPKSLTNTYLKLSSRVQKMQFLVNFLKNHIEEKKVIVFFNTCATVDYYTKLFNTYFNLKQEDEIVGLHGKLKTNRRQKLIKRFLNKTNGCLFATDVVSRGIDFDHIHFIVQVDPPEDPDNYVHRIGRTARINRPGTAILLIEEHEQAFINYLAEKSVGVQQITDSKHYYNKSEKIDNILSMAQKMDTIIRTDRDYVQKSKKAFVSYIRSYKQHDLRYIFEFKNLDIGRTAQSFFMYRIPRIKQILGKSISSFTQSDIDIQAIPWLDKNQELQFGKKKQKRQEELLQKKRIERRLMKNADAKNNKSKRKRIKSKLQNRNQETINRQHRQFLKQKKIGSKPDRNSFQDCNEQSQQNYSVNDSQDTEQIQQRMTSDKSKNQSDLLKDPKNNKIKGKRNRKRN